MEKGISFFVGFKDEPETRARMIKDAGFDRVITTADPKFDQQNKPIKEQAKLFEKLGLKPSSLHMTYQTDELPYFWEEGEYGDMMTKRLIQDVKYAHEFGFTCVVTHLFGKYSKIGEERLLKVLEQCDKLDVPLAIENIDAPKLFLEVFDKIKHPKLKFCYDSGHNNFVDKGFDYLGKFKDKLITLHLHDNDGTWDMHTLNRFGNIDWQMIGEKLNKDIILDYELLLVYKDPNLNAMQHILECKQQADELEKIILEAEAKRLKKKQFDLI